MKNADNHSPLHLISHYFLSLSRSASHSLLSALFFFCARVYFQPNELIVHIHHTFSSRKYERSLYSRFDSTFLNLAELSSCVWGTNSQLTTAMDHWLSVFRGPQHREEIFPSFSVYTFSHALTHRWEALSVCDGLLCDLNGAQRLGKLSKKNWSKSPHSWKPRFTGKQIRFPTNEFESSINVKSIWFMRDKFAWKVIKLVNGHIPSCFIHELNDRVQSDIILNIIKSFTAASAEKKKSLEKLRLSL